MTTAPAPLQALKDRAQIRDCLMRYCRGVDRFDPDLIKSAYHPDGFDDHGIFAGNGWVFADWIGPFDDSIGVQHQIHRVDNVLITFKGADVALVESYNITFVQAQTPDGPASALVGGRYLDRFEKRAGAWKIAHRRYVMDWNMNGPATARWAGAFFGALSHGRTDAQDPSHAMLQQLSPAPGQGHGNKSLRP